MKKSSSRRSALAFATFAGVAAASVVARAEEVVGVTADGRVITFDSASPGTLTGNRVLTGVAGTVVALGVRPANGGLYAVTNGARLYRIDAATGVAVAIGSNPFAGPLGSFTGMDFIAGTDRIRIVDDLDTNLRVNPNDGTLVDGNTAQPGVQQDSALAYGSADANFGTDPNVVALASDVNAVVYGIDSVLDTLVTIAPANSGSLQTVGALGVSIGGVAGFGVSPTTAGAFAALVLEGQTVSGLYNVNLATGGVTFAGNIGHPSAVVAMAVGTTTAAGPPAHTDLVGLTQGGELVRFASDAPGTITSRVTVTGLVAGDTLLAIDTRPSNGRLYGLGRNGRIYVIHAATGLATPIRTTTFEVPLTGTAFGFDFNPAANRVRIVGADGQNLRVDPDTGAVSDGNATTPGLQGDTALAYASTDVNQGAVPHVVAAAYDSNLTTANAPTLWVIDSNLGVLARQGSPNGTPESANTGTLHTVGSLGVDATGVPGLQIAGDSTAFGALKAADGKSRLYTIDLTSGLASLVDPVGVSESLRDLATAPTSNPSAPGSDLVVRKLVLRSNYARTDRDSVRLEAVIPFPAGTLLGQIVLVDVGGFSKAFTLSRVGKAKLDESTRSRVDDDSFAFASRAHDGHLRLVAQFRREDLSDELTDEGMSGTLDARKAPRTVQVTITVNGVTYSTPVVLRYTAKAGKTGIATN